MKKLLVIAVFLLFFTGSAHAAAEWNFYGSARISTFYSNIDDNPFQAGNPHTTNYEQDLNGNARIGAKVKVSDTLTGQFEYGAKSGAANLRLLWGEWNFGAGSLGVGQHYTPLLMPYSNQVYNIYAREDGDTNMSLFGMLYGKRKPMIRLKFGTFQIAAVQTKTTVSNYATLSPASGIPVGALPTVPPTPYYLAAGQPDTEVKLPSIQAKYKYDFDAGHVNFAGGYQTFDVLNGGESYDVTSYVLALGGRLNAGGFYFKGNLWGGQNVGNMADIITTGRIVSSVEGLTGDLDGSGLGFAQWSDGTINTATGGFAGVTKGIIDNDALAALLVAGYEIRKGLYLEAGYGYTQTKLDVAGAEKEKCQTMYLQSTIFLAPGVFLTPEIGYSDFNEPDQPEISYFGIKWQVNF